MKVIYMKSGDLEPSLYSQLMSAEYPLSLEAGVLSVSFRMRAVRGTDSLEGEAEVVDPAAGIVRYVWKAGETIRSGTFLGEFIVEWNGNRKQTFPSTGYVVIEFAPTLEPEEPTP